LIVQAHTSDDGEEPPRSASKAKPKRKPGRPPSTTGSKKARSSLGGMTDDKVGVQQVMHSAFVWGVEMAVVLCWTASTLVNDRQQEDPQQLWRDGR
jgi:hypothetical protein